MEWKTESDGRRKLDGQQGKKCPQTGELDYLTGLLTRSAAGDRMLPMMNRDRGGTLFLCDVNSLRRINEQYGNLAGDECLKLVAQILAYMAQKDDILGRCGGDEFLIFKPACKEIGQAREICERIEKRFRGNGSRSRDKMAFSVTAVCVLWRRGDTCQSLLKRAGEELERRKAELYPDGVLAEDGRKDYYIKDARRVRRELMEQIREPGAYCQDYETFKGIYRFLERGIIRSGQKACVILITVVDEQGRNLLPYEKDALMDRLGEDIAETLRIGDVYTRYSSSQYLVLVIDTTEGQADRIADRIKARFLTGSQGKDILIHHCYELQPARIGELTEQEPTEMIQTGRSG